MQRRTQAETNQSDIEDIMRGADEGTSRLTADELLWVRLAIKKEAQTILFRQAIIEKTISALIWAGIAGLGYVLLALVQSYMESRGWKTK